MWRRSLMSRWKIVNIFLNCLRALRENQTKLIFASFNWSRRKGVESKEIYFFELDVGRPSPEEKSRSGNTKSTPLAFNPIHSAFACISVPLSSPTDCTRLTHSLSLQCEFHVSQPTPHVRMYVHHHMYASTRNNFIWNRELQRYSPQVRPLSIVFCIYQ